VSPDNVDTTNGFADYLKEVEFSEVRSFWKDVYLSCIQRGESDARAEGHANSAVEIFLTTHRGHFKSFAR
jgi:hypothetical protein